MFKDFNDKQLNDKMFIYILGTTIVISMILVIEILVLHYPKTHLMTWIISILISTISIYFRNKEKFANHIKYIYFGLMIFGVLPYGCLFTDARSPFILAYAFIVIICTCIFFTKYVRMFFCLSILIISIIMLSLKIIMPQVFPVITDDNLFQDIFIQVPITYGAAMYLLISFANDLKSKNHRLMFLSSTDFLTGLYNRRYLYEYLLKIQKNSKKNKRIITGMIDANKFKYINDKYGHKVGDEVLLQIVNHIKSICSPALIVSRTGGDEFVVVMEYDKDFEIDVFVEKFNKSTIKLNSPEIREKLDITISGGFVICNIQTPIDIMIAKADNNMYDAKQKVRNGIVITYE